MFINLTIFCFLMSFSLCRTSDNYHNQIKFILKKNELIYTHLNHADFDDELNWKRRHKRRKKAINRSPRRGK
ncbi:MAG: hypothetical protein CMG49_03075 [Candidatus Marinimicrobia bacterium]|nr:hypothetical protein [Candidatus Neomarinimicrobiota bacterium]